MPATNGGLTSKNQRLEWIPTWANESNAQTGNKEFQSKGMSSWVFARFTPARYNLPRMNPKSPENLVMKTLKNLARSCTFLLDTLVP